MSDAMRQAIEGFPAQLSYAPLVVGSCDPTLYSEYIVLGMGGSHLAGGIVQLVHPEISLRVWRNYGLPKQQGENPLVIASSYSGNTEEVLDGAYEALKLGLSVVVITTGGKLLELAKENNVPYVQLPATGIQPRSALGYSTRALLFVLGFTEDLKEIESCLDPFDMTELEKEGTSLAQTLKGKIPVIYASLSNEAIAYNWKIKCNETGKIPAFYNLFPELNHNELAGMDRSESTKELFCELAVVMLEDESDHSRIKERMQITTSLLKDRGVAVYTHKLVGSSTYEKIFRSLLVADWMALSLANGYGLDPEKVVIIESLKQQLKQHD